MTQAWNLGSVGANANVGGGVIVSGTSQASTSGTAISFTGIPSWVKRITVMFNGVSTNGTSLLQIQIGAGSIVSTGYNCISGALVTGITGASSYTSGYVIRTAGASSTLCYGALVINLLTSNTWVASGVLIDTSDTRTIQTAGSLALGGVLDRVQVTTINGTDTFDAGSINILYE
jgi:hypothetical protein